MKELNDWDFLIGSWRVHHRRLRERLVNCGQWDEFEGACTMQKVLGGAGNIDDNVLEFPGGSYHAVTLRAYDPAKKVWSIWWLDSRNSGHLDPPVVGQFEGGTGLFYADHSFNGRPIRVRFRWINLSSGSPRWEQAFSEDGGKNWEINWTMDFTKVKTPEPVCCPVVELRQYTLKPGARDTLIELFEREFIESQEQVGMRIIGTFRDLENPDRFVWLRGFQDMESRADQLAQFYGGPIWKAHREAANATMIDSDNVLLLRSALPGSGFSLGNATRSPFGSRKSEAGLIAAIIYHLGDTVGKKFAEYFQRVIAPELIGSGVPVLAMLVTAHYPNTFPALPVREDADVFVWFSHFASRSAYDGAPFQTRLRAKLADRIKGDPEVIFLAPTSRSLLRG
jgi:hypothetical protein